MKYLAITACAGLLATANIGQAFDTGHHFDVTWRAVERKGFTDDAIKVVQVANWLVDYYAESPTSSSSIKDAMSKLHFDNLFSTEDVDYTWKYLMGNYTSAVNTVMTSSSYQSYSSRERQAMVLTLTGMTLHAIQDFYSHSNWQSFYAKTSSGYKSATYLSSGLPSGATASNPLQTGYYPDAGSTNAPSTAFPHGDYTSGYNKDSHIRPHWDEALVFAYLESVRFMSYAKDVIDDIDDDFWDDMRGLNLSSSDEDDLDDDYDAAIDISMLIHSSGADGHYKGNLSGSSDEFATAAADWTGSSDSFMVDMVKKVKLQNLLVPCLYGTCATPTATYSDTTWPGQNMVWVVVSDVVANSTSIDPTSSDKADFYPRITIRDQKFADRVLQGMDSYHASSNVIQGQQTPAFWQIYPIGNDNDTVDITIELWDSDSFVYGDDDHIDISSSGNNIDVTYHFDTGALSGEISGTYNSASKQYTSSGPSSGDAATVTFYITHVVVNQ